MLPDFKVGFKSGKGEKDRNRLIPEKVQSRLRREAHLSAIECSRRIGFRNGNSLPSSFIKAQPCSAFRARQKKTEGSLLPFLNPMFLEHSIAEKFAATPHAGKD